MLSLNTDLVTYDAATLTLDFSAMAGQPELIVPVILATVVGAVLSAGWLNRLIF